MPIKHGQKIKFRPIRRCECGDHSFVATTRGFVTLVSPVDEHFLIAGSWSAHEAGHTVYAAKCGLGLLHRLIMQAAQSDLVDHQNRNGSDNRRGNLRKCTKSQKGANAIGRSGRKGVSYMPEKKKWRARITVDRKERHLGLFATEDAAAEAYLVAARSFFGPFSRSDDRGDGSRKRAAEFAHGIRVEEVIV